MTSDIPSRPPSDLTAEASAWIAQLEMGDLSPEDLVAFREWVNRSPRHYEEIHRLARIWGEVNVLTEMAGPLKDAAAGRSDVLGARARRRRIGPAAAAALAALAVVIYAFFYRDRPHQPYLIATTVGGFNEAVLPDGSGVELNTDSKLEIDYDDAQRRVRLLRGEAFFDVARNPQRPFVVYAGDDVVRAVGTAFVVRYTDDDLTVTVSDGSVEVSSAPIVEPGASVRPPPDAQNPPASPPRRAGKILEAGQRLAIVDGDENGVVREISGRSLQRELSWREGLLEFSDTPLAEVVREMNRYTEFDIEIADPSLKTLTFGGIFRTGETAALFDALELSFGVRVEYVDDRRVRLRLADG